MDDIEITVHTEIVEVPPRAFGGTFTMEEMQPIVWDEDWSSLYDDEEE